MSGMQDAGREYVRQVKAQYDEASVEWTVGRGNELMLAFCAGWQLRAEDADPDRIDEQAEAVLAAEVTADLIPEGAQQLPADQEDLILKYGRGRLGADPCQVPDCPISAQEHHRLARGIMAENTSLRREVLRLTEGHE